LAGGIAVERLTGRADDRAREDMANVERRIAHLPASEQAEFMRTPELRPGGWSTRIGC
jgi:hypothetical protein